MVHSKRAIVMGMTMFGACGDNGDGDTAAETAADTAPVTATDASSSGVATTDPSTTAGMTTNATTNTTTASTSLTTTDATSDSGVDASSGDASTGPTAGDCSAALLCEDFEGHTVAQAPGAPWQVSTQQGTLAIDDQVAFSGAQSVHITIEGGDGTYRRALMSIEGAPVFPIASGVVWGRMMMNLVAWPAGAVHWTNIQGEGDVPGMGFRGLYRYGGMNDGQILANYETQGVGSDCWRNSQTVMPTGWTCLEWHFDSNTDTMELFVDGAPIDDATVVGQGDGCITHDTGDNWFAPDFDTMRLGWEHYQQTDAKELWIDDVALDDERIGCPG